MSLYFEKRKYQREEMATILKLDPKDKNFAQKVKNRMNNLGFGEEDYIYTRKDVTILWIPQSPEEKIKYLVALLGIDKRVDPHAFAVFVYRMLWDEDYQRMPWKARTELLKYQDDLEYDERTYRSWTNKLIDLNVLKKDKTNFCIWRSFSVDGERVQEEVSSDDVAWLKYNNRRIELFKQYSELSGREKWNKIFNDLWNEFHCVYYKCGSFEGKAWSDNKIIEELLSLISGYYE